MKINRREFVKLAGYAGATLSFGLIACSTEANNTGKTDLDSFGGWKGKKLTKTGFFHTENDGKRWWFVTPEGNAFLSFGINHYHAGWWIQDYNKEYWNKNFGADKAGDEQWLKGFRKVASADMKHGNGTILLNSKFENIGKVLKPEPLNASLKVEGDFPGLLIQTSEDIYDSINRENRYVLKWETIKHNRDLAPEKPWPGPSQKKY